MKLEKKIVCDTCNDSLTSTSHESMLAQIKDKRWFEETKSMSTNCLHRVKLVLYNKYSIFNNMFCVNNDIHMLFDQNQQFDTHRDHLIKNICVMHYNIRLFHKVRKANDQLKLRSKLTKLVHFRHE
ncbi:hypothetical protein QTP88_028562 [Uroleucon formosanum]